ncbi:hypothetical protein VNO77_38904 [Canavalia gladiata]|uniref:Uncharacterized protein n=1 Tax=Canavalia gladiata TaxID=3824 RepID=A0AAN9KB89_CANGL
MTRNASSRIMFKYQDAKHNCTTISGYYKLFGGKTYEGAASHKEGITSFLANPLYTSSASALGQRCFVPVSVTMEPSLLQMFVYKLEHWNPLGAAERESILQTKSEHQWKHITTALRRPISAPRQPTLDGISEFPRTSSNSYEI